MGASIASSAIYISDTPKQIKEKVNKHAVSGGRDTAEEQRKFGANLALDVPYQWLKFFLDDDEELARIEKDYSSGAMLTGEVKAVLVALLQRMAAKHQAARAAVTDDMVRIFLSKRNMRQ